MQVAHLQREASETSRKGGLREHLCLDLCHQQIVSNSPIEVPPADYFARLALDSRHIDIETGFPNRLGRELAPFAPAHGAKDLFFSDFAWVANILRHLTWKLDPQESSQ